MKRIPIYAKSERKGVVLAGYMYEFTQGGVRIFTKTVKREKHYMRMVKGYGMQEEIYLGYIKGRRGWVGILEEDTGKAFLSPMKIWDDKGRTMMFNQSDGSQRFLSEKYMMEFAHESEVRQYIQTHPVPEGNEGEQQPLLKLG